MSQQNISKDYFKFFLTYNGIVRINNYLYHIEIINIYYTPKTL